MLRKDNNNKEFCGIHFNDSFRVFKPFVNCAPTFLYKKANSRSSALFELVVFSDTLVFSVWAQSLHFAIYFSGAQCV